MYQTGRKRSIARSTRAASVMVAIALIAGILGAGLSAPVAQADVATAPVKNARVDGGAWDTGTSASPVPVTAGSKIQYDVAATSTAVPMLMGGSTSSSGGEIWGNRGYASTGDLDLGLSDLDNRFWYNQQEQSSVQNWDISRPIDIKLVSTVTIVNLGTYLTPDNAVAQFVEQNPTWQGKPVLQAWDATEPNTAYNPGYDTQRVVAWITLAGTDSDGSPLFNLYAGGQGGVWSTAVPGVNGTFNQLDVTAIDLSEFHTDTAVSMSSMFEAFASDPDRGVTATLDLSHFDTSHVRDMSAMFEYFGSITPVVLDLSHFDTSQVTDMSYMFEAVASTTSDGEGNPISGGLTPPVLNLSSFDTAQVTNMSGMFYRYASGCLTPPTLDLSTFDTSRVRDMSNMFSRFAYDGYLDGQTAPVNFDLRWFKIGAAPGGTMVTDMFSGNPNVAQVYLNSGVFTPTTANTNTGSWASGSLVWTDGNGMFDPGNSAQVFVATAADQAWMQASARVSGGAPATVTISGAPTGAQPTPKAPLSPAPFAGPIAQTTITDTIPAGLSIDPSTITGAPSAVPANDTITYTLDGQTIIWSVPYGMTPTDVAVTATVDSGLAAGTTFENTAAVYQTATNTTYHRLEVPDVTDDTTSKDTTQPADSDPATQTSTPGGSGPRQPSAPVAHELPKTGDSTGAFAVSLLGVLPVFTFAALYRRRKQDQAS